MEKSPSIACDALQQLSDLLATIDEATFHHQSQLLPGGSIGTHVRHVIEFYECLFEGLEDRQIDYDSRKRNTDIESSPERGACALDDLLTNRWCALSGVSDDLHLSIRESEDQWRVSSVGRELCFASSHAMHHLALIGVLAREVGMTLPPEFGIARSTQSFLAAQAC